MNLTDVKLAEIAAMYGVDVADFGPVEGGYRNTSHSFTAEDGKKYNFILYKNEDGIVELIQRTNVLGAHVATKGLSVRFPKDMRILRVGHRFGSLYGYLDGVTIPWEAYTMKHIKLLGQSMALFHTAAAGYAGPHLPDVEEVYCEILARMKQYFADENVRVALTKKLHFTIQVPEFSSLLQAAKLLPGRTVLHMDLVRSNVLFAERKDPSFQENKTRDLQIGTIEMSGILDLEKAAVGHPLFDVARTLAFLLVDCTKPEEKIRKYFLDSGYRKRGGRELQPVQVESEDLLEQLITLFLTYDFYKFLKQNPYESLPKNHHFKRTVDILLERKVLHYSH